MDIYLTDKDRALLDLRKRAIDHWTKTCAAQFFTCEGCPYKDIKTPCWMITDYLRQLTVDYRYIIKEE